MTRQITRYTVGLILTLGGFATPVFADTGPVFANTCPTHITQDSQGYWTSNDEPGWKSTESKPGITLDVKDFGGVVYSPEKKRLACVYKDSSGQWVVLLSNINHAFEKEKIDLKNKAWELNTEHQDYECGTPGNTLNDCKFDAK